MYVYKTKALSGGKDFYLSELNRVQTFVHELDCPSPAVMGSML